MAEVKTNPDNLNAVVEDKKTDRCAYQIVPMHQGIDQQLLKNRLRDFRSTWCIDPSPGLNLLKVTHDKGHGVIKHLAQRTEKIFGIHIVAGVNLVARITDCFNHELRLDPLGPLGEQQYPGQVQHSVIGCQVHVLQQPDRLNSIMDSLLRHAHMTGTSVRVLRYLDRPLTKAGKPYARSTDEVLTRVTDFNDGIRIRHWVDKNSVKLYNEQNVLRVETTINNPGKFIVFRHKQGQSPDEPKQRLPLRKGVMDIPLRSIISGEVNDRFMDDLATPHDESPARELIDEITRHVTKGGRRFRALDPTGKDRELLQSISDPAFRISGLTNKMLRQQLSDTGFGSGRTNKQLSAKISRHLRLLRVHGIIRKLPRQNRYQLTLKGVKLTNILNAFLDASTENLLKMAA